jgi:Zn-dependent protease with chaperone function
VGFPFFVSAFLTNFDAGFVAGVFLVGFSLMPVIIFKTGILWLGLKNSKKIRSALILLLISLVTNSTSIFINICLTSVYMPYRKINSVSEINPMFWTALFLFLFFLISFLIEIFIVRRLFRAIDRKTIIKAVLRANLVSYLLLLALVILWYLGILTLGE